MPFLDIITKRGITGLVQTLHNDLPKGSLVAQLGMLGWDPHKYYPKGRASAEALAIGLKMNENDLAFRANLVLMEGTTLKSYSANYIDNDKAALLIDLVNKELRSDFPKFEISHAVDFRNVLIIRDAFVDPQCLNCPEPHEHHGDNFNIEKVVTARTSDCEKLVKQINRYLGRVAELLNNREANAIFLWSSSEPLILPCFNDINCIEGDCAIIGNMDFLKGIAVAGGLDFFLIGNGYINTDYKAKGQAVLKLLESGYRFVYCHINAPDEAAHMGSMEAKINSLENIDYYILKPIIHYFQKYPEKLGGLMVVPDHYTNTGSIFSIGSTSRRETHSIDPVPFAIWNNIEQDSVSTFNENSVVEGKYGRVPIKGINLLNLLGIKS